MYAVQVCAFSGEKDVDMRGKVMIRMKDITDTQTLLESCMAGQSNQLQYHFLSQQARLAQSVEHGTLNPRVVGSSPTSGELIFFFFLFFCSNSRFPASCGDG